MPVAPISPVLMKLIEQLGTLNGGVASHVVVLLCASTCIGTSNQVAYSVRLPLILINAYWRILDTPLIASVPLFVGSVLSSQDLIHSETSYPNCWNLLMLITVAAEISPVLLLFNL